MNLFFAILMSAQITTAPAILTGESTRVRQVMSAYWLPTQQDWINDHARKKIMAKCRRFGGSHVESFIVADECGKQGALYDAWITSRDMLAARLFNDDIKHWGRLASSFYKDHGEVLIGDPINDFRAFETEFSNGRIAHALSSNPDAMAGKQGKIVVDEAALHKMLRMLYAISQPAIMRGGSLSLISTHRGSQHYFNALIEEIKHKGNPKKFSLHEVSIVQAVQEGLWIKIRAALPDDEERKHWTDEEFLQSLRDECADEEAWLQEYMCTPCDDAASLLTWEDITACTETSDEKERVLDPLANRWVGFDVARKKHLSVITKLCEYLGKFVTEETVVMKNKSFAEQELVFYQMMNNERVRGARIDASGLGMQLAENAALKFGPRVQGVMFTAQSKLKLAVQLQRRFQDRSIRIPDEAALHYDLYSVKKEVSTSGNIILRSEAGQTDGHSDRFWSYALAVDAAEPSKNVPVHMSLC